VVSENPLDTIAAAKPSPSIEWARYWFEQYRFASRCEARLIRAIREQSADSARAKESV
jgi:hypothetical protein